MGLEILTLGSSKTYTRESLLGLGAVKGAPCTIKSITEVDGGQKVTFEWTGTSGTKQTSEMTVKNGVSITGISDKGNGKFTLLFSDGSESDEIQTLKGEKGLKGDAGFSPTITENADNTDKIYKLDITNADSTFTTPNLKGADGTGGSGGDTYTGTSAVNLGGIKNNQVFNKTPLPDVIDMLLHPYEKPTMTLGINPAKTIYDKVSETLSSITINANVTKRSENIKEVRFYVDNVLVKTDTTHPTGGLVSYTHTFSPATNKTFNVKIECEDIKAGKVSANTTITFIGKSYYGYLKEGTTIDETNIKTLNTILKKELKYKYSAITTPGTDLYHIVLCQPKELGTITSVKDALNFEYIQDYTIQDITVDGLDYKLMYLTNPVSVTDFLQDFK